MGKTIGTELQWISNVADSSGGAGGGVINMF